MAEIGNQPADQSPSFPNGRERRTIGRTPEGRVEIVTTLGKFFAFMFTICTLFLLITNKIVNDSNDRLRLELQNIFITKADALPRAEYELRHRDFEHEIERIEKLVANHNDIITVNSRRIDKLELQVEGHK